MHFHQSTSATAKQQARQKCKRVNLNVIQNDDKPVTKAQTD